MEVAISGAEQRLLRQVQRAGRGRVGYVPVIALLMLD